MEENRKVWHGVQAISLDTDEEKETERKKGAMGSVTNEPSIQLCLFNLILHAS